MSTTQLPSIGCAGRSRVAGPAYTCAGAASREHSTCSCLAVEVRLGILIHRNGLGVAIGTRHRSSERVIVNYTVLLVASETGDRSFASKMIEQEDGVNPRWIDVASSDVQPPSCPLDAAPALRDGAHSISVLFNALHQLAEDHAPAPSSFHALSGVLSDPHAAAPLTPISTKAPAAASINPAEDGNCCQVFPTAALIIPISKAGPASPWPVALWPSFFAFRVCFCVSDRLYIESERQLAW
jgi:hypothetical protein